MLCLQVIPCINHKKNFEHKVKEVSVIATSDIWPNNDTGININQVISGFLRSCRRVTFISPSVKQQIAKSIVTTALKNLSKVVGSTSEQDKSFDHKEYIKQMGQKAKALNEACLKKCKKYKKQFYIGKTKN